MNLCYLNTLSLITCVLCTIILSSNLLSSLRNHSIFLNGKSIIKHDVAVDLLDDIILNKNQSIDFDMNSKTICVKTRTYFFIDFDKNVVGGFFD
jgi:hypothetical protein